MRVPIARTRPGAVQSVSRLVPVAEDHSNESIARAFAARETFVRSYYDQYGRAL